MSFRPLIYTDLPDNAVLFDGNNYYMITTSMHMMPGCPVMKSRDLINWEFVGYVYDRMDETEESNLSGDKAIYGNGAWAVSFKYHKGVYYCAFSSNDQQKFYVYKTEDIEHGLWEKKSFEGLRHDPAILFDDDNTYLLYGNGDIYIEEWEKDMSSPKADVPVKTLIKGRTENMKLRCEGGHAYKIGDTYYLIYIEWPTDGTSRRIEVCYRGKDLFGPLEKKVIFDEDAGYQNRGIAQGEIFECIDGSYKAVMFQDHNAVGRIPYLLDVNWENGWPDIELIDLPDNELHGLIQISDQYMLSGTDEFNFNENKLDKKWQWNHHPDNDLWSLTDNTGFLRLKTGKLTDCVLNAKNTLTQRTYGPKCFVETKLMADGLKDGDFAGLVALQGDFGAIGVRVIDETKYIEVVQNDGANKEKSEFRVPLNKLSDNDPLSVFLKVYFDFTDGRDIATFSYSYDNQNWTDSGFELQMKFTLDHFMGYRAGLFSYASKESGGFADFDYFRFYMD